MTRWVCPGCGKHVDAQAVLKSVGHACPKKGNRWLWFEPVKKEGK